VGRRIIVDHDAARAEADDAVLLDDHGAEGLIASLHRFVLHQDRGLDELAVLCRRRGFGRCRERGKSCGNDGECRAA
jgi:hypothetical protein